MYVLDTDTCVWALRQRALTYARVQEQSPDDLAVTAMTLAELYFGGLRSRDPGAARERVETLLAPLRVLPFDELAAAEHARIRHALTATPIGERDLVIAATVICHRATLVTGNRREFDRVPGLAVETW